MSRYFLINAEGKAYNEIMLENPANYTVPAGHSLTLVSEAPANLQWVEETVVPAEIPSITRRQFLIAAAMAGLLTPTEAETGALPAVLEATFNTLPTSQALAARITWANMTKIERNEPLVAAAAAAFGLNDAEVDAFFLSAAQI